MSPTIESAPPLAKVLTFALIGNPNTGKSSLFNALTGGSAAVGNYAGVTVDLKRAKTIVDGRAIELVDLPGTYSLTARSLDERVSVDAICGGLGAVKCLDGIVIVLDATAIERNLYLISQILEADLPVLLVANMWDRLDQSGVSIDLQKLQDQIGAPIVSTCASKRQGIDSVKKALLKLAELPVPPTPEIFPSVFDEQLVALQRWFTERQISLKPFQVRRLLLDGCGPLEKSVLENLTQGRDVAELQSFLSKAKETMAQQGLALPIAETRLRYAWVRRLVDQSVQRRTVSASWGDRIDQILTHRWYGLAIFLFLMLLLFQVLYSDYTTGLLSSWIEFVQTTTQEALHQRLSPGPLRSLLADGVVAGIGAVLVFVPQIAVLFLLLAIMEDCGYLARVAMVMDRLMSGLGLNGRAFLPLMTSFGCAVPGIMATRTIANRSDRLLTMVVAPLMSCSARLPVYVLMTYAFVPDRHLFGGWISLQSIVLLCMLLVGALVAIPVAWLIRKFLLPGKPSPFVMELPAYKAPSIRVVYFRVRDQVVEFLSRAGTLIFCTAVVVWALLYFPGDRSGIYEKMSAQRQAADPIVVEQLESEIQAMNASLVRESLLGRVGIAMEPVFKPLGWDWRIGVGVLASFPAREVVIATFGTIFALGGDVDESSQPLRETLRQATVDGQPLMTTAVALSIMVFFALCAQCGATLIVMRRESGSWKWPAFTFVYMTGLAYVAAFATFQIASRILH